MKNHIKKIFDNLVSYKYDPSTLKYTITFEGREPLEVSEFEMTSILVHYLDKERWKDYEEFINGGTYENK